MSKIIWYIIGGLLIIAAVVGVVMYPQLSTALTGSTAQAAAAETAEVTTLTAVSSVEASGSVEPLQQDSLLWKTTGTVAAVNVKIGDSVRTGDILMTIDPATAPQSVILAQADLINAQNNLDELLHPNALSVATAEKAVVDAQAELEDAQYDLDSLKSPDVSYYEDQVEQAQDNLLKAQEDVTLDEIGSLTAQLQGANDRLKSAGERLGKIQAAINGCPECDPKRQVTVDRIPQTLDDAQDAYNDALNSVKSIEIQIAQSDRGNNQAVSDAQETLDDAQRDLTWAQGSPDAIECAKAQARVKVAQANLADAQDQLNRLVNGADPDDIAVAQAQVLAAEATVNSLTLTAPFEGEVIEVYFQPGDSVSQSQAAVVLANRSRLHVEVSVDETDISQIALGNPASLTFDSLPDLTFAGIVSQVIPNGSTVAGLIRYTVRVDLETINPKVLNGMTANVNIVTATAEGALAVPLNAIQLDGSTEYVNRLMPDGSYERVNVVSGAVQDTLVVVAGDLKPGDIVAVGIARPQSEIQPPFGGGS